MEERKEGDWLCHVECMRHTIQGYQKSLFIMNNQLRFYGPMCIYLASDMITYPLLSQITKFTLSHFTTQSLQ